MMRDICQRNPPLASVNMDPITSHLAHVDHGGTTSHSGVCMWCKWAGVYCSYCQLAQ
jgi:hypothetical protein